jgi:hypothetical protein
MSVQTGPPPEYHDFRHATLVTSLNSRLIKCWIWVKQKSCNYANYVTFMLAVLHDLACRFAYFGDQARNGLLDDIARRRCQECQEVRSGWN